jgi:hypothetical protein
MKVTFYRLGERKIVESDNGALWWESHAGLGALKSGKCFIRGDILFVGPGENEKPGFLKNEFLNELRQFPTWEKTRYCCSHYTIQACGSGATMTQKKMGERLGGRTHLTESKGFPRVPIEGENHKEGPGATEEVSYKLGRYEIIKMTDGQVRWKTYSGCGSLRGGQCAIAGDILFVGVGETGEPGYSRHDFFEYLSHLPEWKTTQYYCTSYSLYDCRTGKNQAREQGSGLPSEAPCSFPRGTIAPLARNASSYPPRPKLWRIPLLDSSLSFLKEISAKVGKSMERKPRGAGLKSKSGRKNETNKSALASWSATINVSGIKRRIAYIGAFFLAVALLLAFLLGYWKKEGGHHRKGDHSSGHHRER